MVVVALKTLTWSTVAAAVASALLLAWDDGAMPRLGGAAGEPLHASRAAAPSHAVNGAPPAPTHDAPHDPSAAHDTSWH